MSPPVAGAVPSGVNPGDEDIQLRKRRERERAAALVAAIPPEAAADYSGRICRHVQEWEVYRRARTVMVYVALRGEPDLADLIDAAEGAGVRLCVPRVDWQTGRMTPVLVRDWSRDLVPGRYGVFEPGPGCTVCPPGEIDLVLVPGVAFDESGGRLGRGRGFYDRFLRELEGSRTGGGGAESCGVCFSAAVLPDLPMQPHDVRVRHLCTEQGLRPIVRHA